MLRANKINMYMPKNCGECPFCESIPTINYRCDDDFVYHAYDDEELNCYLLTKDVTKYFGIHSNRPDECPLEEIET